MSWRRTEGRVVLVSPRGLQPGDRILHRIGGVEPRWTGANSRWQLRYYIVESDDS